MDDFLFAIDAPVFTGSTEVTKVFPVPGDFFLANPVFTGASEAIEVILLPPEPSVR